MKLTVLGCWAPYPRAGGACSGYLVQTAGKNILLECGNGVFSNLQKHIDFRSLDVVLISHFHPDHYMDLFCLRHAVSGVRRTGGDLHPVSMYLPGEPEKKFREIQRFTDAFKVKPVEDLALSSQGKMDVFQVTVGDIRISFSENCHPLKTYSITIESDEGKLFYSADTMWYDQLPLVAQGADLILCEASVIEADREYTSVGHLTARQAGELALQAGVEQLAITHFWPEYSLGTLVAEAEQGFGGSVTPAEEGLEIKVEPFALLHAPAVRKV